MEDPQITLLKRHIFWQTLICLGLFICSGCALMVSHLQGERVTIQGETIRDQRARLDAQRLRIDLMDARIDAIKSRIDGDTDMGAL